MVQGALRSTGSPVVPLEVAGQVFEAVIDTGFEGGLQLPEIFMPILNRVLAGRQRYELPDGSAMVYDLYDVVVLIDGINLNLRTQFSQSDEIILGTDALQDYRLEIDFVARTVVLERMTP